MLDQVGETLGLSTTEIARLFGVRRQTVSDWYERGIPGARQAKAASLAATCDLLHRYLKPERIPGIARQPADAYDGLTMLEMIEAERHEELRERVRRSFSWSELS